MADPSTRVQAALDALGLNIQIQTFETPTSTAPSARASRLTSSVSCPVSSVSAMPPASLCGSHCDDTTPKAFPRIGPIPCQKARAKQVVHRRMRRETSEGVP